MRWRRKDLARWLLETFAISLDETIGRELKALGFAKISARPRHYAQNELAVEAFKKNFPAELAKIRARLPKGVEIELWWQAAIARIGQKNKLTRRWARRGTRPRAPRDQRTEWASARSVPRRGKAPGWSCPGATPTPRTSSRSVPPDPGAHAVLIVDQAGWHLTPKLAIPDNITVLAAIARVEVENVWQFMRDNWLSNRIFKSYEDIVALCCQAWNNLRPTMEDHVPRHAQMGAWVLINDRWYHSFRNNEVRLQLHALAYNLANFMRTLALPKEVEHWSLTTLREKLVKIGAKVVSHGRYVTFQLAEVAVPRALFAEILRLIDGLRPAPLPP